MTHKPYLNDYIKTSGKLKLTLVVQKWKYSFCHYTKNWNSHKPLMLVKSLFY